MSEPSDPSQVALRSLREARHQLTEKLAEIDRLNRELVEARRAAELAARAKATFLATMSHEIRTPLTAVLGVSELLGETPLSAEQREFVAMIRSSGGHLLAVINDILDISRLEAGGVPLERAPFRLSELLRASLHLVAAKAKEKGLRARVEARGEAPERLVGDAARIRQILANYLANAVKFTSAGEVVLTAEVLAREGATVTIRFAVRDSGIGIPEEAFDRLFRAFSQVDASTQRRFGGSGLGLAICDRLAQRMGGRVWVESRVGAGSTFFCELPLEIDAAAESESESEAVPARRATEPRPQGAAPLRILVAEDNPLNVKFLSVLLARLGHRPTVVGDGHQVLQALRCGVYDLILMDVQMPGMDGLEATRRIVQEWPPARRPRVVALTAGVMEDERALCLEVGMTDFLSKPVSTAALAALLAAVEPVAG